MGKYEWRQFNTTSRAIVPQAQAAYSNNNSFWHILAREIGLLLQIWPGR
jgi:hypothetical protein